MRKILALLFLLLSVNLWAQNDSVSVKIIVSTEAPVDSGLVYIAGNQPQLGGWHPGRAALKRVDNLKWELECKFKPETVLEFKFTRGAWEAEAVDSNNSIPVNYTLTAMNDTILEYKIHAWRNEVEDIEVFRGQITGKVEYLRNLQYDILLPRDVIIWLPPGYDSSNERYPVLYMHDGQNTVDPATTPLGVDWQIDEAADSLIRSGEINPFIMVGVYNSRTRNSDYRNCDTGFVYVKFLADVLKPKIDSLYRTKPEPKYTFNGGSSMGGIISLMAAWERSDVFGGAICFSPAFKISSIDYVTPVSQYSGNKKDLKLFIANGGIGLEERLQPGVDEMVETLKRKGFVEGTNLLYKKYPEDRHTEGDWARRIPEALIFLFGKGL